jgi:trans-AT polyketide synthase, acyltransferase and oxidoreductase domains
MVIASVLTCENGLRFTNNSACSILAWQGSLASIAWDQMGIRAKLNAVEHPCYIVGDQGRIGVTHEGSLQEMTASQEGTPKILAAVPPLSIHQLGDPEFLKFHGVKYAYAAGAMANGIASAEMIIALGQENILAAFGAGGLTPDRIAEAIRRIQQALPNGPYAFNLIHSPSEAEIERRTVDLYINQGVTTVEASAFLDLTPHVVRYRASGLSLNPSNQIEITHKVIAKVSRAEVARKFMQPAPQAILQQLVAQGLITELQATLAEKVPMADDITVEADSGGHTDNRPLVCLLPTILNLRDNIQVQHQYDRPIRVGAAGGISTPHSVLAAFVMGAAYVVTGSINQSCVEAGTSAYAKSLLAQADMADMAMAPAADMFEMGVKLQVLKRGTFFPMRSQKLFDYYKRYNAIEEIPAQERQQLEQQIFKKDLETVWQETVAYFSQRDPDQITRAINHPKRKMALIFRSYLGQSSRWAILGELGREADYQIWCGPAMGSFNAWVEGTYLAKPDNRRVEDIARHLMQGAAILYRLHNLSLQGLQLSTNYWHYSPQPV